MAIPAAGARLRRRRRALHLTLKDVADRTGLTEGLQLLPDQ
ncbi:hypothetical protein AB0P17_25240 [Streptomyces sp. NPDC088124]